MGFVAIKKRIEAQVDDEVLEKLAAQMIWTMEKGPGLLAIQKGFA